MICYNEAVELVDNMTIMAGPYKVVRHEDVLSVLSDELFREMLSDKVFGIGPSIAPGTVYAWNVVSYLLGESVIARREQNRQRAMLERHRAAKALTHGQ